MKKMIKAGVIAALLAASASAGSRSSFRMVGWSLGRWSLEWYGKWNG